MLRSNSSKYSYIPQHTLLFSVLLLYEGSREMQPNQQLGHLSLPDAHYTQMCLKILAVALDEEFMAKLSLSLIVYDGFDD